MKKVSFIQAVFADVELGQVTAPTLLLIGDHEIMYAPQKALENAARLIPEIQAELVQTASHILNSDQPELIDTRVLQFLASDSD
jgi:pimeloyl-ACP methyl ester carboxylesterase